jgi:protein-S-isoprenylcysteine O-methyltransferase Ste14
MSLQQILNITVFIWVISEGWILARDIGKTNAVKDSNTRIKIILLGVLGIIISLWLKRNTTLPLCNNTTILITIGIILIWLGILLRQWAVRTLGKYFRTHIQIQKDHKVIQTGPYKYIRHPSYSAALLSVLGYGLTLNNWLSLIVLCTFVFFALYQRIIAEEKVLAKDLGKEYQSYQKRTKKLVPGIF